MPFSKIRKSDKFFKKVIKLDKLCPSREHNPPGYIVLKPGRYQYTCPSCGHAQTITVPEIRA